MHQSSMPFITPVGNLQQTYSLLLEDEPRQIRIPCLHGTDHIVHGFDLRLQSLWDLRPSLSLGTILTEVVLRSGIPCNPSTKELADLVTHREWETDVCEDGDEEGG